jgi:hypothetical protein
VVHYSLDVLNAGEWRLVCVANSHVFGEELEEFVNVETVNGSVKLEIMS